MTDTPRLNAHRLAKDEIELSDQDSDEHGWPYVLLLGTTPTTGWTIECDMEEGAFNSAFTPAGRDAIFVMSAKETPEGVTTVSITPEGGTAVWDEATKTLTITNGEP